MRIIFKPAGIIVLGMMFGGAFFALSHSISSPAKSSAHRSSATANLISGDLWKFYSENTASGAMEPIKASLDGSPLPGYHIIVDSHTSRPWNIGITNPLKTAFNANEQLKLHFWARSQQDSTIEVMMQKNTPGFPNCFQKEYKVGPQWKEFSDPVSTMPMAAFESMLAFHCGYQDGWVEVVGIDLER
jgi:hypothetical protein